jgi:hypothetical protein
MQLKFLKYVFWGLTFPIVSLFFLLIRSQAAYSFSGGQVRTFIEEVSKLFGPQLLQGFLEQNPMIGFILLGFFVIPLIIYCIVSFFKK